MDEERIVLEPVRLEGRVELPLSKSQMHRLLIAEYVSCITHAAQGAIPAPLTFSPLGDDLIATSECLEALAASDAPVLACCESASTLRFLLPVVYALGRTACFTGTERLAERPLQPLLTQLAAHGCRFSARQLPFTVSGQLTSGRFELPGNVSSQFITGLLFALPLLERESELVLTSPLESAGYVEMTLEILRAYGITVLPLEALQVSGWRIPGGQRYMSPPGGMPVPEPDYSAAAFWLVANALGAEVELGPLPKHSTQPDSAIIAVLESMHTDTTGKHLSAAGTGVTGPQRLRAVDFDACHAPDLVCALAVAMAVAEGTSRITNAARLRFKESDRLAALATNLRALGARIEEQPAGLVIEGVEHLHGGHVSSCGDHRIALALALAATVATGPIILAGPAAVSKSYPTFWEQYQTVSQGDV